MSEQHIRVMTHGRPEETRGALLALAALARAHGALLVLDADETAKHPLLEPVEGVRCNAPADLEVGLCVTLGGDGTILRALRTYAWGGVPVFGVNYGQVGFLATVDPDGMREGFERAIAGQLDVLRLPAIELGASGGHHVALNDVALHRRVGGRVAELSYAVSGELVGSVRCDGIVVATPAGSTGYNLANGGPVMAWGVAGMVVSFIAPHSLSARALVIAPDDELTVHNRSREALALVVDGRPVGEIEPEEVLEVRFRDGVGALMQIDGSSFYRRLREKFGALCALTSGSVPGRCYTVRAMLHELTVQNLLLIEEARLELAPGLNVITGETGAGKTVLAGALDLLLGGRPRAGIVRPGASEAYVEGTFELPEGFAHEQLASDASELVLARRIGTDGRTRAYLGGRSIPVGELRDLAAGLLRFYGQHEHRRLMLGAAQLEILDAYCGPEQRARLQACAAAWGAVAGARAELDGLRERSGARERELDLLEFELAEIEQVAPEPGEREELAAERERLRNIEGLRGAAWQAEQGLADDEAGALRALHAVQAGLESAAGADPALEALAERARTLAIEADDLLGEVRSYAEGLEVAPGRLEAVDERLTAIARLERKHGGTVESVLAHAAQCRARREELAGTEQATEAAQAALAAASAAHESAIAALSASRAQAAPALAEEVAGRLAALAMGEASFAVTLVAGEAGRTGAERAQFEIAPNPGVPAAPLRDVASGGELSRVMLALLTVAGARGSGADAATLVFDEIDAGVGGHTARAVAEQLRDLAEGRQILVITHLPQVASLAARHFTIAKDTAREPARTTVTRLGDDELVGELVRMLGADAGDSGARRHAKSLLRAA